MEPHQILTDSPQILRQEATIIDFTEDAVSRLVPLRQLLALFFLITLVPAVLLIPIGWRSLDQDRVRALQDSREQAADLAVSSLQQSMLAAERQPKGGSVAARDDAAIVTFEATAVKGKRLFYPFTSAGKEAAGNILAAGEKLEFHEHGFAKARALFADLARSPDRAVRYSSSGRWDRSRARLR